MSRWNRHPTAEQFPDVQDDSGSGPHQEKMRFTKRYEGRLMIAIELAEDAADSGAATS
jgi:hypothetical protein